MKKTHVFAAIALVVLGACAKAPVPAGYDDPHEVQNRRTHKANIALDQMLVSPAAQVYGQVPKPTRTAVANFADNASLPGTVVNKLLQGQIDDAVHNTVRFLFNSTFGLLGLFDVASDIGLEERESDFGETLHVWGMAEGDYVVLPFFGASTERDTLGIVGDFVLNPLGYVLPTGWTNVPKGAWVMSKFGDRYDFADSVDSILYSEGDGYATLQLYYLDSRRYELGQVVEDDELDDLYEAYDG
ncbi:putative phospholipid-binding lipoprotein MlaA [Aliiroseovarius sp. xm-m-379]|uniref:MlaA family lipoprotein n=1 Tax=unclassified Aliiroseovarius TaxID=2623558 RepID=UPI0015689A6B|nr:MULTISPECIES: VacJ family lipoprotein [unclassified Aliiroseovarius]NRP13782.1 putative phospholipid-binding lipoprotein MlaA [Aliiroseovarius sp. xm-d-517]NRP25574.1 putative phospholipid-binding lipoprotein MlaA [Aliiroseovarius sp. xm-m-379]NRP29567.1 putative phospholipid-binding lipoprotein MlaA [Aliiroseovarius sp. xm-m-314]NRP34373.1 putative phospholipid-binding lipoprotein MlaA [Aliiroseovarius sp. xm-a-104]NRP41669.1 putative phospholipid-binding lipoprotein MlaA [Aliiroseovarius 